MEEREGRIHGEERETENRREFKGKKSRRERKSEIVDKKGEIMRGEVIR